MTRAKVFLSVEVSPPEALQPSLPEFFTQEGETKASRGTRSI
jgi:hypothetical protein